MPTNVLQRHSLKIRITLTTLFVFLLSIWSLSYYASHALRVDMERLLDEQQYSTVTLLAAQLDREMDERLRGLEGLAANLHPAIMENPASLQTFLEQHPYNQGLFNDGILAYNSDGIAVATYPFAPERMGVDYMDRDYVSGALKHGKTTIGRPVIGRTLHAPIFVIAVPIRNFQGKVIGALGGLTNLSKPNFLDKITDNRYGKTGGYLLIDSRHRLVVTATDKSRIMEEQRDTSSNPAIESFYQGREGSAVYTNAQGIEMLASFKNIPEAGWQLGANLPVSEAFAPIDDMQRHMLLATLLLTLLAWSLGWWLLKRQLAPLLTTLETLGSMSDTPQPARALPIAKQDEIGQLIGGFNR